MTKRHAAPPVPDMSTRSTSVPVVIAPCERHAVDAVALDVKPLMPWWGVWKAFASKYAPDGSGGPICFKTSMFSSADTIFPRFSLARRIDSKGNQAWTKDEFPIDRRPDTFCADTKGNTYVSGNVEYPAPHYSNGASIFRQVIERFLPMNWRLLITKSTFVD